MSRRRRSRSRAAATSSPFFLSLVCCETRGRVEEEKKNVSLYVRPPFFPSFANPEKMLWRWLTLVLPSVSALECYYGRGVDNDMKRQGIVEEVSLLSCLPSDVCCLRFAVSKCCTLKARKYSIADGTCGNASVCNDANLRTQVCDSYGSTECRSTVCDTDHCNSLRVFDSTDAAHHQSFNWLLLFATTLLFALFMRR